jgi:hypothetical protein
MVQESIIADMRRNGFELVSVQEPDLCSDDPTRVLMRQMMGAFHQYEKTMIVAKLKGARLRAKAANANGRCEGNKPFGHYAGEQVAVDRMVSLRTAGVNYTQIAAILNTEDVQPRKAGTQWFAGSVQRILVRLEKEKGTVKESVKVTEASSRAPEDIQHLKQPAAPASLTAIQADVISALVNLGSKPLAAEKAVRAASGDSFDELFRASVKVAA